jgi:hypothetical protein
LTNGGIYHITFDGGAIMIIANPIYDTTFEYLMKNIKIARGVISTIIGEKIVKLDLRAQESVYKGKEKLMVYHLDFVAKIQTDQGKLKDVLIELQKSKYGFDIMRFRNYLGEEYKKGVEVVDDDGETRIRALPIITIYFLGFRLSRTLPGVIKVARKYVDVLGDKEIEERNNFIECLSHNSYVIQVPGLKLRMRTDLEYILSVFAQEKFRKGTRVLKEYDYEPKNELMRLIVRRLAKAAGDEKFMREVELEEMAEREYENAFGELERKLMRSEETILEKEKELGEKDKQLSEKDKMIAAMKREMEEIKKNLPGV